MNWEYYTQTYGAAIGSPLGPTVTNALLCHFEKKLLLECSLEFLLNVYKWYVDDIFATFNSYTQLLKFVDYMNYQHPNIKFTFKVEKNNNLSLLNINICRKNNKFRTSVFRNPTFSVYLLILIVVFLYHTSMV